MTTDNDRVNRARSADRIIHNAIILDGDPAGFTVETADDWLAEAGGVVIARGRGSGWQDLSTSARVRTIDAEGAYLAPGYVDIHCHGAGGSSAEDGDDGLDEVLATVVDEDIAEEAGIGESAD